MIDLHMHSTFSDGSFTPGELLEKAVAAELTAIALTDHDTIDGVAALQSAAAKRGLETVTGVELSAEYSPGTMHILGYHFDIDNGPLGSKLEWIKSKRAKRNREILERLNELGLELDWEEVAAYAGSEVVGRPHFAQAMIARGYCSGKQEVFDKYLAKGQRAYVNRARMDPAECIDLIRNAGGVAVLAHPVTLKLSNGKLREKVAELVDMGLGGIECYYSKFSEKDSERMSRLAREFDLAVTGGTDFHGASSPDIGIGSGFGNLAIPDELLAPLRRRAAALRQRICARH